MGIWEAIKAFFGFGTAVVDLTRENKQRADEPVHLAESQQEKIDEKKGEIAKAVRPEAPVEDIREKTGYSGP